MDRREFLVIAATTAVAPHLAAATPPHPLQMDWREIFKLKDDEEILGVAFCHPGEALTEDDIAERDGIARYGELPGPSVLAQKGDRLATLLNVKALPITEARLFCGFILGSAPIPYSESGALDGDAHNIDKALRSQLYVSHICNPDNQVDGRISIPTLTSIIPIKSKIEGLILWRRPSRNVTPSSAPASPSTTTP